jgi:hypothetical protein
MDTIQTLLRIVVLLVAVNAQLAREEAILNVRAAPLATTSNPLQLTAQILVQVMDTIQTRPRIAVFLVLLNVPSAQEATIPNAPTARLASIYNPLQLLV